jgi:hypothetical protein
VQHMAHFNEKNLDGLGEHYSAGKDRVFTKPDRIVSLKREWDYVLHIDAIESPSSGPLIYHAVRKKESY